MNTAPLGFLHTPETDTYRTSPHILLGIIAMIYDSYAIEEVMPLWLLVDTHMWSCIPTFVIIAIILCKTRYG